MKVKILDKEIQLFYTMRMMIIYENITGESVDFMDMKSVKQLSTLLLSCIIASAKKQQIEFNITYDEYADWLDDNGGYVILNDFATWLANEIQTKYSLLAEQKEKDDFPKSRKKAKG